MTEQEFAQKIDWEGGILEALGYGLRPDDAPPGELRDAWAELRAAFEDMRPLVRRVEGILDRIEDSDDD